MGKCESTGGPHLGHPPGAIGTGARENHRHPLLAPFPGNRFEQPIDAGARTETGRWIADDKPVAPYRHIPVGGRHSHDPRPQQIPVHGCNHLQRGDPLQQLDNQAGMVRGKVLGHHIGHQPLDLELAQEHLERLQAAGGSTDPHHMVEGPSISPLAGGVLGFTEKAVSGKDHEGRPNPD